MFYDTLYRAELRSLFCYPYKNVGEIHRRGEQRLVYNIFKQFNWLIDIISLFNQYGVNNPLFKFDYITINVS